MSSTNRSNARYDHTNDYYITPVKPIIEFLQAFVEEEYFLEYPAILDPCAGGDPNREMSYPKALKDFGYKGTVTTCDIREDSLAQFKIDYLNTPFKKKYHMIISNPPFKLAEQFIKKCLDDCEEGGFVVLLLRLNFLGGVNKRPLWNEHLPKYMFVHHRRMSFTDDGKTDSIEYAHFVWQKGYKAPYSRLVVL